eukprot:gnl/Chilomastix_cuspidata/912.p1 GENE.gnl/Chilomastix_cuspidata/912~~gnl/Chilomastix_cuspidata/912.p1  ORF type:complete len:1329 (+),score=250.38 gnl/Chilomastix_cuspidata/912:515-4501(+)
MLSGPPPEHAESGIPAPKRVMPPKTLHEAKLIIKDQTQLIKLLRAENESLKTKASGDTQTIQSLKNDLCQTLEKLDKTQTALRDTHTRSIVRASEIAGVSPANTQEPPDRRDPLGGIAGSLKDVFQTLSRALEDHNLTGNISKTIDKTSKQFLKAGITTLSNRISSFMREAAELSPHVVSRNEPGHFLAKRVLSVLSRVSHSCALDVSDFELTSPPDEVLFLRSVASSLKEALDVYLKETHATADEDEMFDTAALATRSEEMTLFLEKNVFARNPTPEAMRIFSELLTDAQMSIPTVSNIEELLSDADLTAKHELQTLRKSLVSLATLVDEGQRHIQALILGSRVSSPPKSPTASQEKVVVSPRAGQPALNITRSPVVLVASPKPHEGSVSTSAPLPSLLTSECASNERLVSFDLTRAVGIWADSYVAAWSALRRMLRTCLDRLRSQTKHLYASPALIPSALPTGFEASLLPVLPAALADAFDGGVGAHRDPQDLTDEAIMLLPSDTQTHLMETHFELTSFLEELFKSFHKPDYASAGGSEPRNPPSSPLTPRFIAASGSTAHTGSPPGSLPQQISPQSPNIVRLIGNHRQLLAAARDSLLALASLLPDDFESSENVFYDNFFNSVRQGVLVLRSLGDRGRYAAAGPVPVLSDAEKSLPRALVSAAEGAVPLIAQALATDAQETPGAKLVRKALLPQLFKQISKSDEISGFPSSENIFIPPRLTEAVETLSDALTDALQQINFGTPVSHGSPSKQLTNRLVDITREILLGSQLRTGAGASKAQLYALQKELEEMSASLAQLSDRNRALEATSAPNASALDAAKAELAASKRREAATARELNKRSSDALHLSEQLRATADELERARGSFAQTRQDMKKTERNLEKKISKLHEQKNAAEVQLRGASAAFAKEQEKRRLVEAQLAQLQKINSELQVLQSRYSTQLRAEQQRGASESGGSGGLRPERLAPLVQGLLDSFGKAAAGVRQLARLHSSENKRLSKEALERLTSRILFEQKNLFPKTQASACSEESLQNCLSGIARGLDAVSELATLLSFARSVASAQPPDGSAPVSKESARALARGAPGSPWEGARTNAEMSRLTPFSSREFSPGISRPEASSASSVCAGTPRDRRDAPFKGFAPSASSRADRSGGRFTVQDLVGDKPDAHEAARIPTAQRPGASLSSLREERRTPLQEGVEEHPGASAEGSIEVDPFKRFLEGGDVQAHEISRRSARPFYRSDAQPSARATHNASAGASELEMSLPWNRYFSGRAHHAPPLESSATRNSLSAGGATTHTLPPFDLSSSIVFKPRHPSFWRSLYSPPPAGRDHPE